MTPNALENELAQGGSLSIIHLFDLLIAEACQGRTSDIHLDPVQNGMRVRFRRDGLLYDVHCLPQNTCSEIIGRIKVLAGLRTDEHAVAQDGRFRHQLTNGNFVDVRVAIAPTYRGENAVLRLLTKNTEPFTLSTLGFTSEDQRKISTAIRKTSGMILVTGPTGSGKTTTLYTLLHMLNSPTISLVTIEDPIEYEIEHVTQIQTRERVGFTFANGLRTILRQDPNIIMLGEIRDAETGNIAVNTALTGHLLLSTLHTNDAVTALPRLMDMKIEALLLASTVSLIIAQRLVRKICQECKTTFVLTSEIITSLEITTPLQPLSNNAIFYHGNGCDHCEGSGFSGRLCISEILVIDSELREAILRKSSSDELKSIAIKNGMTTMFEDGLAKARSGETTLEEVLRVIHE